MLSNLCERATKTAREKKSFQRSFSDWNVTGRVTGIETVHRLDLVRYPLALAWVHAPSRLVCRDSVTVSPELRNFGTCRLFNRYFGALQPTARGGACVAVPHAGRRGPSRVRLQLGGPGPRGGALGRRPRTWLLLIPRPHRQSCQGEYLLHICLEKESPVCSGSLSGYHFSRGLAFEKGLR